VYGQASGGDPEFIPDLTFEEFRAFYDTCYHPSNCLFVLYGDLEIEPQLKQIQAYLQDVGHGEPPPPVMPQRRFEPQQHTTSYPITSDASVDGKTYAAHAILVGRSTAAEEHMAMGILARILSGTPASPLFKALVDSRLGEDVFFAGYEGDILDTYYSIGLKGTDAERVPEMVTVIETTLQKLADDGIDPKMIESAVNSIEFDLREANFGGYPKGLVYGLMLVTPWLYDADPFTHLYYRKALETIKRKIAAGRYFEDMIADLLLRNPHSVTLTMTPDPELEPQRLEALGAKLASHKASLAPAEVELLVEETGALLAAQMEPDSPEALATIPKLPLSCVGRQEEVLSFELIDDGAAKLSFSEQPTNGITYLQLSFDVAGLPQRLLPYLPIFSRILLQAGTTKRDYVELTQDIGIHTGGISCSYSAGLRRPDRETVLSRVSVGGKALTSKLPEFSQLVAEITGDCDLSNLERIKELVTIARSKMQAQIIPGGHRFAALRLSAYHSRIGHYREVTSGLTQYDFLVQLEKDLASSPDEVLADLQSICRHIFSRQGMHIHVTGGRDELAAAQAAMPAMLDVLSDTHFEPEVYTFDPLPQNEGLIIPSKIQYVGKGANLYDAGYQYHGSFEVLDLLLSRDYLWNTVRVQGNAYGAFVSFAVLSGNFCCLSYRDPKMSETLEAYDRMGDYIAGLDLGQADFERFVIGTMGGLDSPRTPDAKGSIAFHNYLGNVTASELQLRREQVLDCTLQQIKDHVDVLRGFAANGTVCVVGSEEVLRHERDCFDVVRPVFID
ncbi:MAG: insulinase family protein, partial [Lentisphaeria bacterium]